MVFYKSQWHLLIVSQLLEVRKTIHWIAIHETDDSAALILSGQQVAYAVYYQAASYTTNLTAGSFLCR